jgi:hypothetical protein
VRQVKKRFENNKEVYDKFLDIMKDFQSRMSAPPPVLLGRAAHALGPRRSSLTSCPVAVWRPRV